MVTPRAVPGSIGSVEPSFCPSLVARASNRCQTAIDSAPPDGLRCALPFPTDALPALLPRQFGQRGHDLAGTICIERRAHRECQSCAREFVGDRQSARRRVRRHRLLLVQRRAVVGPRLDPALKKARDQLVGAIVCRDVPVPRWLDAVGATGGATYSSRPASIYARAAARRPSHQESSSGSRIRRIAACTSSRARVVAHVVEACACRTNRGIAAPAQVRRFDHRSS